MVCLQFVKEYKVHAFLDASGHLETHTHTHTQQLLVHRGIG